jgi:hypothetical protein
MRNHRFRASGLRRSLGVLAATLVLAGCGAPAPPQSPAARASAAATPLTSSTPTSTSSPTPQPSAPPRPTLAFEIPADVLPPLSLVVTSMDGLQLRLQPGLTARAVVTARAGARFRVANWHGPIRVDGLDWYQLTTAEDSVLWAPIGAGGDAYLELVPPRCPAGDPDLATLAHLTEWERLACFDDRSVTVVGTYGSPITSPVVGEYVPGSFEPAWLAYPVAPNYLVANTRAETLHFRVTPDSGLALPGPGTIVRATGHFNDPAADDCTMTRFNAENAMEVDPRSAQLYCREQFVLDSYDVVGSAFSALSFG